MREVRSGVRYWQSPHPDWNEEQWWPELVSSYAIVTGDSLENFGDGLDIQLGGRKHVTREDVVGSLRPLLDLPIELVLPAHGEPTDRAELERVLS
ncbi:MAG TPA: hypothetical protein VFG75_00690 [Gaiella sp.]|nr:hypothetical protein [Gaiella sp.]